MIARLLNDDIFISYARADASAYADALAGALQQRGFSVFIDRLGTEANAQIPRSLMTKLHGAAMLVLVGSPAAAASGFVGEEVRSFSRARGSDRVVPIDVGNALAKAQWFEAVAGIAPEPEPALALEDGEPSSRVVARVEKAFVYTRSKQRLRRSAAAAMVLLAVLLMASGVAGWQAQRNLARASQADAVAQAAEAAASAAQRRASEQETSAQRATAAASAARARADAQQRVALSRQLSALALERLDTERDAAALWAERAWAAEPTAEAERALVATLTRDERLMTHLHGRRVVGLGSERVATVKAQGGGELRWSDLREPWALSPPLRLPAGLMPRTADDDCVVLVPASDDAQGDPARRLVVLSRDGRQQWELQAPVRALDLSLRLAPGPVLLAGTSNDGSNHGVLARWELLPAGASRLATQRWPIDRGWLEALSPDGRSAVVTEGDELTTIDALTGARRRVAPFRFLQPPVGQGEAQTRFLQSGRWLAIEQQPAGSIEVQLWDVQRALPAQPPRAARMITASANGTRLVMRRADGAVQVISTAQARPIGPPLQAALDSQWSESSMSGDGRWLILPRANGVLQVFDLDRERALGTLQAAVLQDQLLAWQRDGRLQAVPAPRRPDPSRVTALPRGVRATAMAPDGRGLAWVTDDDVTLRDRADPSAVLWRQPVVDSATSAVFSPDGRWLAIGYEGGRIDLIAAANGQPSQARFEHPRPEPDPNTTELDSNTGRAIVRLQWRPDGRRLATVSWFGDTWVWQVEPDEWARAGCRLAGRPLGERETTLEMRGLALPPSHCVARVSPRSP